MERQARQIDEQGMRERGLSGEVRGLRCPSAFIRKIFSSARTLPQTDISIAVPLTLTRDYIQPDEERHFFSTRMG